MRLDETMLVKQLLPEICHFLHTCREGNQHAAELRNSASGVLFSLSCNNFNAVFSRISTRLVYINNVGLLSKINFNFLVCINILNRMTFIWMFVEILCIFLTFYIMFTVILEILMCTCDVTVCVNTVTNLEKMLSMVRPFLFPSC